MKHDLSTSWRRHDRAKEHAAEVKGLVDDLRSEGKLVLPPESQAQTGEDTIEVPPPDQARDDLAIRVGEVIYNLRAALDYAVHVVSGRKSQSQFPLEDTEEGFNARKTGRRADGKRIKPFLRGVPKRECDLIEAVQPYKGVDWSRRLRDLSNPDKHRDFVVVNATSDQAFIRKVIAGLYASGDLYPAADLFPSAGQVEMHSEPTFDIALGDGALLTQALEELEAEVGALLTRLEST